MKLPDLVAIIESPQFSAEMNIASSNKMLVEQISNSTAFHDLGDLLQRDTNVAVDVLNRLKRIAQQQIDFRYENPLDIAVAVYILALDCATAANLNLGPVAAEIATSVRNTWWAIKIARYVLDRQIVADFDAETVGVPAAISIEPSSGLLTSLPDTMTSYRRVFSNVLLMMTEEFELASLLLTPKQVTIENASELFTWPNADRVVTMNQAPVAIVSNIHWE